MGNQPGCPSNCNITALNSTSLPPDTYCYREVGDHPSTDTTVCYCCPNLGINTCETVNFQSDCWKNPVDYEASYIILWVFVGLISICVFCCCYKYVREVQYDTCYTRWLRCWSFDKSVRRIAYDSAESNVLTSNLIVQDIDVCVVCKDAGNLVNVLLFPCNHSFCSGCANRVTRCPLCRSDIEERRNMLSS